MFLKLPSGETLVLDPTDPRLLQLEPYYLESVRDYLRTFRTWRLTLSMPKSVFAQHAVDTLGHHVTNTTVSLDKAAFAALAAIEPPPLGLTESRTSKQLQSTLGSLGYVAQGIADVAVKLDYQRLYQIASRPLSRSQARVGASNYGPTERDAITQMRDLLLRHQHGERNLLDPSRPVFYVSDACNTGWSAALFQVAPNGRLRLIRCIAGRWAATLSVAKTISQEAGACTFGARAFNDIFPQVPAALWRTDSHLLTQWESSTDPTLRRWWFELSQILNFYPVCVGMQHLRGTLNPADDPSRLLCMPQDPEGVTVMPLHERIPSVGVSAASAVLATLQESGHLSVAEAEAAAPVRPHLALPVSQSWLPEGAAALSDAHGPLLAAEAGREMHIMAVVTRSLSKSSAAEKGGGGLWFPYPPSLSGRRRCRRCQSCGRPSAGHLSLTRSPLLHAAVSVAR